MILGSGIIVVKEAQKSLSKTAFHDCLSFVCLCTRWQLYFISEERELYKIVIGNVILLVIGILGIL